MVPAAPVFNLSINNVFTNLLCPAQPVLITPAALPLAFMIALSFLESSHLPAPNLLWIKLCVVHLIYLIQTKLVFFKKHLTRLKRKQLILRKVWIIYRISKYSLNMTEEFVE